VHRAYQVTPVASFGGETTMTVDSDNYYITATNASHDRDIVVTHIWFDTSPRVDAIDSDLPVRLAYSRAMGNVRARLEDPRGHNQR
jgi:hypothetical protein